VKILGMISGTSHDGIDAALVDFQLDGHTLRGTLLDDGTTPYDPALRARLRAVLPPAATPLAEVCALDTLIGQAFADVAGSITDRHPGVDVVTSHGQTVFHWVAGTHALGTLQLGQPAWIAERTGASVVSDVRIRDITVGGHGAPLVSILDILLLGSFPGVSAALNLGGISNMTVIDGGTARSAHDIGPANALLDAVVAADPEFPGGFDDGGKIAATGTVDEALLSALLDEPYYALPTPKSTGKELFHLEYVRAAIERSGRQPATPDLLATLTELTAVTVARDVLAAGCDRVVASGGGCRNPHLLGRLTAALRDVAIMTTDELGAPADTKEAIAFALIGWCTMHGLPGNVTAATGAGAQRVLGTITPGRGPLALPPPLDALPRSLVLEPG
jgi:anhydro-N-acetylmuramic acid kinase